MYSYIEKLKNGYELKFSFKESQSDSYENYWSIETWNYDETKDKFIITYVGHDFTTEHNENEISFIFRDVLKMEEENEVTIELIGHEQKCELCSKDSNNEFYHIYKNNEGKYILRIQTSHWDEYYDRYDYEDVEIGYCPWCGKKLE